MSFKCKKCKDILVKKKITNLKDFNKWGLKNHPDKGGELPVFQEVSNCVDIFFKNNECDINKNYGHTTTQTNYNYNPTTQTNYKNYEKFWNTKERAEKERAEKERAETNYKNYEKFWNTKERAEKERAEKERAENLKKPCDDGYERNPKTGRCRIKCKDYQYRDHVSNRCRKSPSKEKSKSPSKEKSKSPSSTNKKPCPDGYERSLKSDNCLKKCGPGKYRSSKTSRCRKGIKSP